MLLFLGCHTGQSRCRGLQHSSLFLLAHSQALMLSALGRSGRASPPARHPSRVPASLPLSCQRRRGSLRQRWNCEICRHFASSAKAGQRPLALASLSPVCASWAEIITDAFAHPTLTIDSPLASSTLAVRALSAAWATAARIHFGRTQAAARAAI